jgi:hypothetical protein
MKLFMIYLLKKTSIFVQKNAAKDVVFENNNREIAIMDITTRFVTTAYELC